MTTLNGKLYFEMLAEYARDLSQNFDVKDIYYIPDEFFEDPFVGPTWLTQVLYNRPPTALELVYCVLKSREEYDEFSPSSS